jgi:hypothetical protein
LPVRTLPACSRMPLSTPVSWASSDCSMLHPGWSSRRPCR